VLELSAGQGLRSI